jgi:pyruvate dehydrogenase E1 component alpha subunit
VLDDAAVERIAEQAGQRVEAAVEFAKSSPLPDPDQALRYVFAEEA